LAKEPDEKRSRFAVIVLQKSWANPNGSYFNQKPPGAIDASRRAEKPAVSCWHLPPYALHDAPALFFGEVVYLDDDGRFGLTTKARRKD